jgi:hypothetical protein
MHCSLNTAQMSERLEEMAALGREGLTGARRSSTHAELRFAAGSGIRERVERVVAAEADCCAFLTMRVTDEGDAVTLTIDAPEDAAPLLGDLLDAFGVSAG